ncbi:MAG: ABC transporter permease subunit [Acidimicrobiales bacterium]
MELTFLYINEILIFVIFAVSLNLLMGYAGQVSVAPAAFGAFGGYAMAYLWSHQHMPLIWDLLIGLGVAGLAGLLVGIPALRLTTVWLILLTLAFQTIVGGLLNTLNSFGGSYGIEGVSGLSIFGHKLITATQQFPLMVVVAAIAVAICWRFGESPYGRVLRAIREDETATRAVGKNVFVHKLLIFTVTSALSGLAGVLLILQVTVASPSSFDFAESTAIIAMVILGGMGNLLGSVLGAAIVTLTVPFFQYAIKLSAAYSSLWQLVAYGLLLVIIVMFRSQGLVPEGVGPIRLLRRVFESRGAAAPERVVPALAGAGASPPPPTHIIAIGASAESASAAVASRDGRDAGEVVLSVGDLSKRFGGIVAVDEVSIELHRGTITALVGPNGAGKTTVFNLLTGAIRPDRGRVVLNGVDVARMTPNQVARRGMVRSFQDVRIFPRLSCLHNVAVAVNQQPGEHTAPLFFRPVHVAAAERATREQAMRWLEFVGMASMADAPAGSLAFGQQKLVALARVLATEAEVLLLDEPASGIDHQWVEVMLELIEALRPEGRTVCIVEHNLAVVGRLAEHIYFMELGRITAQGALEELTGDRRLAEAYFGTG